MTGPWWDGWQGFCWGIVIVSVVGIVISELWKGPR
jgi:hypothetical protein